MKKVGILFLALVLVISMMTACTKTTPPEETAIGSEPVTESEVTVESEVPVESEATAEVEDDTETEVTTKDRIILAISTSPDTFDPNYEGILFNDAVLRLVYDGLIRLTENNEFEPWLAESYEAISDTEWKFTLRDVYFSDGTKVTSEDCAASIQATHDSATLAPYASWLDSVEILDEKNFIIHTVTPSSRIELDLAHYNYIIPAYTVGTDYDYDSNPVGTGPYKLVEWQRGDHLLFEAKPDYFMADDAAQIKYLEWRIIPEGISRTIALQNGEVDFVYDVQSTDLAQLESDENVTVYSTDYASPFYMAFNLTKEPTNNVNLRKAIASAINRENASAVATNSYSKPINSCFVPGMLGFTDEFSVKTDLEAAKTYLADSGLPGNLSLTVITKEAVMKTALESVQADLQQIGITLNIELLDLATYTARGADLDFDMIVGKYGTSDLLIYSQGAFVTDGPFNFNGIADPELDALILQGVSTIDKSERAEIINQIIEQVDGNVYRTGIYLLTTTRAYNSKLAGFETNIESYDRYNKLYWLP